MKKFLNDMSEFDAYYESEREPEKKSRYENWAAAKGMQAVDGLRTSGYLDDIARQHIEGNISSYEAAKLVESYYEVKSDRSVISDEMEADIVASRINILIGEGGFSIGPQELQNIHRTLFEGLFDHAGEYRTRNILKKEWVLDGDSVTYGDYRYIAENVERFIKRESFLRYSGMDDEEILSHLTKYVSDLWQVHPFNEGNTRTIAVFAIKYFLYLGFDVDNHVFHENSWYFRNALVRANYTNVRKRVDRTQAFLEEFLSCVLFGYKESKEFHNRDLHIYSTKIPVREFSIGLDEGIKRDIEADPGISRSAMARRHGVSEKTIERHLKTLGYVFEGPSKTGHWVKFPSSS